MNTLRRAILLFTIFFAIMIIAPALLDHQFGPYDLIKTGDVMDIFTPLILIPSYWLLFRIDANKPLKSFEMVLFLVFAAMWAHGQGMHLGANAIGHLLVGQEGTVSYRLTNFFDEELSHYLWHVGLVGLSTLLLWRQWHHPYTELHPDLLVESVAGFIFGFVFFIDVVEAQTATLGVPFAIIVVLFVLLREKSTETTTHSGIFVCVLRTCSGVVCRLDFDVGGSD